MKVLYHAYCDDGFGAAYAIWRIYGSNAEYIPVQYGKSCPGLEWVDEDIVIVDFSYPREILLEVATENRVLVLDHHKTAQEDLAGLPFAKFDLNKSGAILAWEHFHPDKPAPLLLHYIQDRDLWRFELEKTHEVTAALGSYPHKFEVWDHLECSRLAMEGAPILQAKAQFVGELVRNVQFLSVGGYDEIPVVNATAHFSDVVAELNRLYPSAPFAAYYLDRADGNRQWGLRSADDGIDVGALAKSLGGGGHRHSAGFTEPIP